MHVFLAGWQRINTSLVFFVGAAAFLSSHGMAGEKHALVFGV
jgi:hypothetical protein